MKRSTFVFAALLAAAGVSAQDVKSADDSTFVTDSIFRSLPEVMVSGRRPVVKAEPGKLVFDMDALTKDRPATNAYDALKEIPGVDEKEEQLTLLGGAVTVIIDGRVSTMTSEQLAALLKSMPKSRVAKCEVMYSAPARYGVRGRVLNVVLRHGGFDGLQGELFGAYRQSHDARFEERVSLLYNKGKAEIDLLYSHPHGDGFTFKEMDNLHTLATGEQYQLDTEQTLKSRSHDHKYRLGFNYNFAEENTLSIVYTGGYSTSHTGLNTNGSILSTNMLDKTSWLHNVRADYVAPWRMKLGAEYTRHTSPSTQTFNASYADTRMDYLIANDQKIDRWRAYLSQEFDAGKGWGVNFGAFVVTSLDNSFQTYRLLDEQSSEAPDDSYSRRRETTVNIYAGASKAFSEKLQLDFSLAAEYLNSTVWNGWDFFPTLNLTYMPSQSHILSFSVESERKYPEYWAVGDFVNYMNGGYGLIKGNPELKPSRSYNATLSYVLKSKYIFAAWFEYIADDFKQMAYQRPDQLVSEYKYVNANHNSQFGVQASAPLPLGKRINSRLTLVGLWQREKNDQFYDIPYDRSKWMMIGSMKNTFTLTKQLALTLDGHFQSKAIQGPYDIRPMANVNASLKWKLLADKLQLTAYCNDIFETRRAHFTDTWRGQNLGMNIRPYREAGVTITYRFGDYKERKREAVDTSRFK